MPWEHKDGTLISQIDQNSQIEYFQYYFKLLIQNQNWNRVCSFEKEKSHRYRLKMLDFMVLKYRDQFESMIFHKFSYNSIPACMSMFEHQAVRALCFRTTLNATVIPRSNRLNRFFWNFCYNNKLQKISNSWTYRNYFEFEVD